MKKVFLVLLIIVASLTLKAQYHHIYFSDDTVVAIKNEAYHLYLQGKCNESINYYKQLILIDSLNKYQLYLRGE